jgi:hypothetical protein
MRGLVGYHFPQKGERREHAPQIIAVCCLECAVCRQQLLFSRDEMKSDMQ